MRSSVIIAFLITTSVACIAQNPVLPIRLQAAPILALAANSAPSDVAVGDFNHDGRPDLAVTERGLNRMSVYLQTTAGFPAAPSASYPAGTRPSSIVAVPLDRTEMPAPPSDDLVTISGPDGLLTPFFNKEDALGSFRVAPTTSFGNAVSASISPRMQASYIDRDRNIDIAFTYDDPQFDTHVQVRAHRGGGVFDRIAKAAILWPPASLTLADLDQDTYPDLIAPMPNSNQIRVLIHTRANFTFWIYNLDLASGGINPVSVAAGDINFDYYPDIAVANAGSNNVVVLQRTSPNQYTTPITVSLPESPRHVLLRDMNNDGAADIVVATTTRLLIYPNTQVFGPNRFGTPVSFPLGGNPDALRVADVNGDEEPDLVLPCAADNTIHVFYNLSRTPLATQARQNPTFALLPNPAADQLTVRRLGEVQQAGEFTLIDALGRVRYAHTLTGAEATLSVADVPRGLYVARLRSGGSSFTQRVLLQ